LQQTNHATPKCYQTRIPSYMVQISMPKWQHWAPAGASPTESTQG
jgi:hypothetical protein